MVPGVAEKTMAVEVDNIRGGQRNAKGVGWASVAAAIIAGVVIWRGDLSPFGIVVLVLSLLAFLAAAGDVFAGSRRGWRVRLDAVGLSAERIWGPRRPQERGRVHSLVRAR